MPASIICPKCGNEYTLEEYEVDKFCKNCDILDTCPLKAEISGDSSIRTMEYVDGEGEDLMTDEYE